MEPKRPAAGRVEETEPEEWWSGGGDGSKMFSVTLLRMRALLPALAGRTTRWHLSPFSNAFFHRMATTELAEFADDWVAFVCVVACQCVCLWDAHYFLKDSLRIRLGSMMAGRDWKREFSTILWALCTAIPKDPSMILRDLRRGGRRSRGRRGGRNGFWKDDWKNAETYSQDPSEDRLEGFKKGRMGVGGRGEDERIADVWEEIWFILQRTRPYLILVPNRMNGIKLNRMNQWDSHRHFNAVAPIGSASMHLLIDRGDPSARTNHKSYHYPVTLNSNTCSQKKKKKKKEKKHFIYLIIQAPGNGTPASVLFTLAWLLPPLLLHCY